MVWPEKFYQGRFDTERRREEKFKSRLRLDMEFYYMYDQYTLYHTSEYAYKGKW